MRAARQAELVRVLGAEARVRVGCRNTINVYTRVFVAAKQPLEDLVDRKLLRWDCCSRFNVTPLHIPALRQRQHAIFLLANHILRMFNHQYGRDLAISGAVTTSLNNMPCRGTCENCAMHWNMRSFYAPKM